MAGILYLVGLAHPGHSSRISAAGASERSRTIPDLLYGLNARDLSEGERAILDAGGGVAVLHVSTVCGVRFSLDNRAHRGRLLAQALVDIDKLPGCALRLGDLLALLGRLLCGARGSDVSGAASSAQCVYLFPVWEQREVHGRFRDRDADCRLPGALTAGAGAA